jgi:hypothetical protein
MQAIPDDLDYSEAEHIYLEEDTEVSQVDAAPRSPDYRLVLTRPSHGAEQTVTLYDDGSVSIDERNRKTHRKFTLHARFLDACPEVTRHIAKRAFIAAGVTASLGFGLLALPMTLGGLETWRLPTGILLATTSLFALLLAIYRTGDTLRFASLHGRVSVLTLRGSVRLQQRCDQLLQKLFEASDDARQDTSDSNALRDEMRDHHRLKLEGIIDDANFEAAKVRILSAHD